MARQNYAPPYDKRVLAAALTALMVGMSIPAEAVDAQCGDVTCACTEQLAVLDCPGPGCPAAQWELMLTFETGSTVLCGLQKSRLTEFYTNQLAALPANVQVFLEPFTTRGAADYEADRSLAVARAGAIKDFLTSLGFAPERLIVYTPNIYGRLVNVADRNSPRHNRVEIDIRNGYRSSSILVDDDGREPTGNQTRSNPTRDPDFARDPDFEGSESTGEER